MCSRLLIHWPIPNLPNEQATCAMAAQFAKRQIDRLYVCGSNTESTAKTIGDS